MCVAVPGDTKSQNQFKSQAFLLLAMILRDDTTGPGEMNLIIKRIAAGFVGSAAKFAVTDLD